MSYNNAVSDACLSAGRNKKPNRTGRTEPFYSGTGRNRTRNRTEPNLIEPRRVRKTQAEPRRTGKINLPNQTDMNRTGSFQASAKETLLSREPSPFSAATETALLPPIWCFESISSRGSSSPEECFNSGGWKCAIVGVPWRGSVSARLG